MTHASKRPRIGIPIPTSAQIAYNQRTWPQYAAAVAQAGGEPVEISLTLDPAAIAKLCTTCQGILLPGSHADVNPAKYGEHRLPETAEPDLPRENVDELLLQDTHNLHKPLLAICYGAQTLNCWRTGTLVQDLVQIPVNHRAGGSVAVAHSVLIEPSSQLAQIVGDSPEVQHTPDFLRLPVNSSHHQAIGIVGDGLRVTARCPQDAVVESIEGTHPGHFVLGLQWHPERSIETSPASRLLFQRFVKAAAAWEPRSITDSLG
ncbi:MAG TPA: gamma-glutamyl-gamma-aminobutyrate hydrolase family protein [Acidobacteriaceae bacterium]|nr:gamma-glutamyl-gamma-aminobutyrate hydrolase family protein [Acidobacteriaceae bacterium]